MDPTRGYSSLTKRSRLPLHNPKSKQPPVTEMLPHNRFCGAFKRRAGNASALDQYSSGDECSLGLSAVSCGPARLSGLTSIHQNKQLNVQIACHDCPEDWLKHSVTLPWFTLKTRNSFSKVTFLAGSLAMIGCRPFIYLFAWITGMCIITWKLNISTLVPL